MSPEALIPMIGTACVALGAGLAKWGPDFFRWLSELTKGRTAVTLRVLDETAKGREETQRTFEELGSQRERIRWLKRELDKANARIAEQAKRIAELEARVKHLEGLVLDMIGPPAPPASVTELKGHRR